MNGFVSSFTFILSFSTKDLFQGCGDLDGNSGDQVEGAEMLAQLLRGTGPQNDRGDGRIPCAPCDGQLCRRTTDGPGDVIELHDPPVPRALDELVSQPFETRERSPAVRGNAADVFARQESGRQRAPCGQTESQLRA